MPKLLAKVSPERDAYVEWSTIVDSPTRVGTRAAFAAAGYDEERLARCDKNGTTARWFDWLPDDEQELGWNGGAVIYRQIGLLPRDQLSNVYDLLSKDINAEIPLRWLDVFPEEEA